MVTVVVVLSPQSTTQFVKVPVAKGIVIEVVDDVPVFVVSTVIWNGTGTTPPSVMFQRFVPPVNMSLPACEDEEPE